MVSINPRVFIFQETPLFCLPSFTSLSLSLSLHANATIDPSHQNPSGSVVSPPSSWRQKLWPQPVLIPPQPVLIPTQHFLLAQIGTSTLLSHSCSSLNQNICFSSSSSPPLLATFMLCFGEESEADRTNMNAKEGEHGGDDGGDDEMR
jgi:hypothetical protein